MKRFLQSHTLSTGLAIFSMFFGAGNLMYPILVGIQSGTQNIFGMAGFLLTAVCLPLAGLVGMILFDENYKLFFNRLGDIAGSIVIAISLIIIGPLVAIPRIATLSHTMIAPFIPIQFLQQDTTLSSFIFAVLFFALTFSCTYKKSRVVDLLGYVISPLLLLSLVTIIVKGIWFANVSLETDISPIEAFASNIIRGYETLDLLGAIFFSYVALTILKKSYNDEVNTQHKRAIMGLKAGGIGLSLLAAIYIGLSYLGVHFGPLLPAKFHAGEILEKFLLLYLVHTVQLLFHLRYSWRVCQHQLRYALYLVNICNMISLKEKSVTFKHYF